MGIIQKQAIKGTVYSYLGVIIGFFTTAIIFPRLLSTDEIGLLKLLVSFSVLFAQFGSLGFNSVINRLFPDFRDSSSKHKGFIAFALIISLIGFALTALAFEIYKPVFIRNNQENSSLLVEYVFLIVPLVFATLFFNLLDTYNKVLYDAVLGVFLKEFLQRILILLSVLMYFLNILSVHQFVYSYVISLFIPTLILLLILIFRGEMTFIFRKEYFSREVLKEMAVISAFGFIGGLGSLAIVHIDSLLVNRFLGLGMTGIYTTTFYFGTLVLIPSRPLIKISTPVLADSWKSDQIENIKLVYYKSCINQSLIGLLIFVGLWVNIDNILFILPEEFAAGKYVILFIGLANVFEMSAGVSGMVIGTSKYFRLNAIFIFLFLLFLIGLNILFIPAWGLTGAAFATTLARIVYTLLRFFFLYRKFSFQPYTLKFLLLILTGIIAYISGFLLPRFPDFISDLVVRSLVVLLIFSLLTYLLGISEDANKLIRDLRYRYLKKQ